MRARLTDEDVLRTKELLAFLDEKRWNLEEAVTTFEILYAHIMMELGLSAYDIEASAENFEVNVLVIADQAKKAEMKA